MHTDACKYKYTLSRTHTHKGTHVWLFLARACLPCHMQKMTITVESESTHSRSLCMQHVCCSVLQLQCVAVARERAVIHSHCLDVQRVHTCLLFRRLQHTTTYCDILQHTATYCNILQHTATHHMCNTYTHVYYLVYCNRCATPTHICTIVPTCATCA